MKILHILNKFDSLDSIAKSYNVTIKSIMDCNNITLSEPLPEKLQIPVDNTDFVVVHNLQRDFLLSDFNYEKLSNVKSNLQKQGFVTDANLTKDCNKVLFTKKSSNIYVVGVTETLDSICKKFSLNKMDVVKKNNLKNERLFIGQMLNL